MLDFVGLKVDPSIAAASQKVNMLYRRSLDFNMLCCFDAFDVRIASLVIANYLPIML